MSLTCPRCYAANPTEARYCNQCGAVLAGGCPDCGHANPDGSRFCNQCGATLLGTASSSPPLVPSAAAAAMAAAADAAGTGALSPDGTAPLATNMMLEGERKQVTVMFADVSGFTSMSEQLDPEDVHAIMNRCFEVLVKEVHRYEGTINQFTGDGIMALFGAPVARQDSPQRAVLAALAIQHALQDLAEDLLRERGITFRMRIGLNTGLAVVGAVGSATRADYTAVGDTTNLAARMEQMAEPGTILIAESTYRLVQKAFDCKPLGQRQVKGREEPVQVYQVLGLASTGHGHEALHGDGPLTPFTGREDELRFLRKHVDRALAGEGRVIGIMAETGIGKSRLVHELLHGIDQEQVAVAQGHCLSYGARVAYMPFADMLRDLRPCGEGQDCAGGALYELVTQEDALDFSQPDLGLEDLLAGAGRRDTDTGGAGNPKRSVFDRLLHILFEASRAAPLLLVLEDLQWIDPTSEELLGALIRGLGGRPICLICTFTPQYRFPWADRSYYRHLTLDPLSRESSAAIVRAFVGGARVPPEMMTLVQESAEGNPFYLEASLRTLRDDGFLEETPGEVRLARPLEEAHIPDSIQDIVMTRIDRLADPVKRTLQVAATIGRVFEVDLLATVLKVDDLSPELDALVAAELITARGPNTFAFRQGVTRQVANYSLLRGARQDLHLRVGRAIEWLYGDRLPEFYSRLGYHYAAADQPEEAIRYLRQGGHSSARLGAMREGAEQVEEALGLLKGLPESVETMRLRVDLLEEAAEMRFLGGDMREAVDLAGQAVALAEAHAYRDRLGRLYITLGGVGVTGGVADPDAALNQLRTGLELCEEAQDEMPLSRGYMHLGNALRRVGRWDEAGSCYQKMVDIAQRHPNSMGDVVGPSMLALLDVETGHMDRARAHAEEALRVSAALGSDWAIGFAHAIVSDVFFELGELDRAEALAQEGLELGQRLDVGFVIALARATVGRVAYARGEYGAALKHFKQYLREASGNFAFAARVRLGETALALGQIIQAYGYANGALEVDPGPKDLGRAERLMAAVLLRHHPPQLQGAQDYLHRAIARYQELEMPLELGSSLAVEGLLARAAGDTATADTRFEQARALFEAAGAQWRLAELERLCAAGAAPVAVL